MTFCQTVNSVKLITKLFREHYDVLKSSNKIAERSLDVFAF